MPDHRRTRRSIGVAALLVAALAGCSRAAEPVTRPADHPAARAVVDTGRASGPQDPVAAHPVARASAVPTRIVIPSIGVDAALMDLARDAHGVLQAPPPGELRRAGWYAKGTVPGDVGPAVIAGHVDWVDRVAVFHRLGELRQGDAITVAMSDGSRESFVVDRTTTVSKSHFPTASVYGPTPDPQLRVITCGGPWDDARNIYSENVVVYASERA